jgi:hypothetical protein
LVQVAGATLSQAKAGPALVGRVVDSGGEKDVSEYGQLVAGIYLFLLREGRCTFAEVVKATPQATREQLSDCLKYLRSKGAIRKFEVTEGPGLRPSVTWGVTADCRVPRKVTLRELIEAAGMTLIGTAT